MNRFCIILSYLADVHACGGAEGGGRLVGRGGAAGGEGRCAKLDHVRCAAGQAEPAGHSEGRGENRGGRRLSGHGGDGGGGRCAEREHVRETVVKSRSRSSIATRLDRVNLEDLKGLVAGGHGARVGWRYEGVAWLCSADGPGT
jgi:hypothetical protein